MKITETRTEMLMTVAAALAMSLALGCGGAGGDASSGMHDAGGADGSGTDAAMACGRTPAAANRARKVVVSHPFGEGGSQTNVYEVFDLDTKGGLTAPGMTFEMGRASDGPIVFTSDGEVGVVAQMDGTLGVFRPSGGGIEGNEPQVIDPGYNADGAFYATEVVMSEQAEGGSTVYVLNGQWRRNGGGIYAVTIACDGSLSFAGQVAPSKLPRGLALPGAGRALVAATDIHDSTAGHTVHLLELDSERVITGVDAFGDSDVTPSASALTAAGDYLLVGDAPNDRVAVVGIDADALSAPGVLSPIEDPFAIVASPDGDGAIVVSGYGDGIFELDFDDESAQPFSVAGELDYAGANPQLPGSAVMIERGDLRGLVLVAENQGVRMVRFAGRGKVVDQGLTSLASGYTAVVGAIGVQP